MAKKSSHSYSGLKLPSEDVEIDDDSLLLDWARVEFNEEDPSVGKQALGLAAGKLPDRDEVFRRLEATLAIESYLKLLASTVLPPIETRAIVNQLSDFYVEECYHAGVDTACTPAPAEGGVSFPLDEDHGFVVKHDKVWDGSVEDPGTGLCRDGIADSQGRCIVDFETPKGLAAVAPVICPQYEGDGCCSWQQNYALYQNLRTLVDSFGSATGCLACAVNLVNFWCALICSPDQGNFVTIHDPPYAQRADDLTGGSGRVLQADVTIDGDLACRIYDSCKSVAIVAETTAMQSGLGLLKFQMQTGAVGHGEYFFLHFANVSTASDKTHPLHTAADYPDTWRANAHTGKVEQQKPSSLQLETLSCDSFYDPGSSTVPFAYPPKREHLSSCSCDYCAAACTGGRSIDVDVSDERPIPVFDGFGFGLVGSVYAAVVACSLGLLWGRRRADKRMPFFSSFWASMT